MHVQLYGLIAEKAGTDRIEVDAPSLFALRDRLEERIADLPLLSYAIAVDRVLVNDDRALTGKEEIAVLPPFAGG